MITSILLNAMRRTIHFFVYALNFIYLIKKGSKTTNKTSLKSLREFYIVINFSFEEMWGKIIAKR